jgi:putative DNA methylase
MSDMQPRNVPPISIRKKLIEVALPLEKINAASAREKSIRHGHPSTLHLWWARRPLAAARAVIFAQMVDDPSSWPELFPTEAAQEAERQRLFRLIEQLVLWENTTNEDLLQQARDEIWKSWRREAENRREEIEKRKEEFEPEEYARLLTLFDPDKLPAFHDPFAGGGALPLEAQRLGLESYASDLNPVAVLINKAMIEIPPKFAGMPPVNPESRKKEIGNRGGVDAFQGTRGVMGMPPVNPESRKKEIGNRGGVDAFQGTRGVAESADSSAGGLSSRAAPATRGDVRDAITDHPSGSVSSSEHRGGVGARVGQRESTISSDSTGVIGGSRNAAHALRADRLVSQRRNQDTTWVDGRGRTDTHNNAAQVQAGIEDDGEQVEHSEQLHQSSLSSLLAPPSYKGAQGLAEDVRYYGQWMRDEAEKRIGHLYPKIEITPEMTQDRPDLKPYVGKKLTVIAWLWARTVKSPNPAFRHVDVPLASTFMLSTKPGKEAYVEPIIGNRGEEVGNRGEEVGNRGEEVGNRGEEVGNRGEEIENRGEEIENRGEEIENRGEEIENRGEEIENRSEHGAHSNESLFPTFSFLSPNTGYHFTVRTGKPKDAEAAKNGTKLARGANFRCLMSNMPITGDYIKAEGRAGRMGARLMAIVAEGERGRVYLAPTPEHEAIARQAQPEWEPEVEIAPDRRSMFTPLYGMTHFKHLFTPRQLVALNTFADLVGEARERVKADYLGARASRPHTTWHRTHLPHFEAGDIPQHIVFRLADSLPAEVLARWNNELSSLTESQRAIERRQRVEAYLDDGHGACALRDDRIAAVVDDALHYFDGTRYQLHEWVVMPNHVHVLLTPLHGNSLSSIVHSWKSFTAKRANEILGRTGRFWQEDYFDRVIRDEQHWHAVVAYVRENPVRARLCASPEEWRFGSAGVGRQDALDEGRWRAGRPRSQDELPLEAGGTGQIDEGRWRAGRPRSQDDRPLDADGTGQIDGDERMAGRPRSQDDRPLDAGDIGALDEGRWRAGRPRSQDLMPLAEGGTGATAYAEAVSVYLGFAISRSADRGSNICSWDNSPKMEALRNTFGRQAIPMVWDFAEGNPLSESSGNWMNNVEWGAKTVTFLPANSAGTAKQTDATNQEISSSKIVSTDPPYYDNIGYADLSDFFYVWLRRTLRPVFPNLFATLAVPKAEELVATPYRHGGKEQAEQFFLSGMTSAMGRLAEQVHAAFPVTIYYAFKQSETDSADGTSSTGWETFLDAVIRAGFAISGTWPMRTELSNRMIGAGTNALASSIVLVCRPRPQNAPTITRRDFVAALQAELPGALRLLQGLPSRGNSGEEIEHRAPERPSISSFLAPTSSVASPISYSTGIAPVDLAQASIGPGMAVFTRYSKVIDASGKALSVREALALINATLDEVLAEQEGNFDADTRWALAWFEQYGFDAGEYGVAETLSKAKNTSVSGMVSAGLVASGAGKVRLLRPAELSAQWNPTADSRLTVWEMTHQLVRVLEQGEQRAAELLAQLGAQADIARELAYRLYAICERKKRAAEALAYNSLVQSWPEMARLAGEQGGGERIQQGMEW